MGQQRPVQFSLFTKCYKNNHSPTISIREKKKKIEKKKQITLIIHVIFIYKIKWQW